MEYSMYGMHYNTHTILTHGPTIMIIMTLSIYIIISQRLHTQFDYHACHSSSVQFRNKGITHCAKKPVTTMLTYPWKCAVLHCNHLGNTWKPLVLMTRHFDYCPSASEVRSSAPVVSRCFPGGYNVKLYISRGRLAWSLLAFLCCGHNPFWRRSQNCITWHQRYQLARSKVFIKLSMSAGERFLASSRA